MVVICRNAYLGHNNVAGRTEADELRASESERQCSGAAGLTEGFRGVGSIGACGGSSPCNVARAGGQMEVEKLDTCRSRAQLRGKSQSNVAYTCM